MRKSLATIVDNMMFVMIIWEMLLMMWNNESDLMMLLTREDGCGEKEVVLCRHWKDHWLGRCIGCWIGRYDSEL